MFDYARRSKERPDEVAGNRMTVSPQGIAAPSPGEFARTPKTIEAETRSESQIAAN
jgi:hypothetical protein